MRIGRVLTSLAVLAVCLAATRADAQDRALRLGQAAAQQLCAECHATAKGAVRSPASSAPTFEAIASTPGMSSVALRAALQTSHRSMPNIMLQSDELGDIVAYIMSLKPGG